MSVKSLQNANWVDDVITFQILQWPYYRLHSKKSIIILFLAQLILSHTNLRKVDIVPSCRKRKRTVTLRRNRRSLKICMLFYWKKKKMMSFPFRSSPFCVQNVNIMSFFDVFLSTYNEILHFSSILGSRFTQYLLWWGPKCSSICLCLSPKCQN